MSSLLLFCVSLIVLNSFASSKGICNLPPEPGLCYAYFERYYYDPKSNRCKMFVYGGCRGNANNFYSERACRAACAS
uniref:Analgesic peptide n=1 Tax=Hemiscorpius lepturus TaxID=520031 RepID=A0A6G5VBU0_HEMLE|nr:leptucin [Hemiscorpius lepturus]